MAVRVERDGHDASLEWKRQEKAASVRRHQRRPLAERSVTIILNPGGAFEQFGGGAQDEEAFRPGNDDAPSVGCRGEWGERHSVGDDSWSVDDAALARCGFRSDRAARRSVQSPSSFLAATAVSPPVLHQLQRFGYGNQNRGRMSRGIVESANCLGLLHKTCC